MPYVESVMAQDALTTWVYLCFSGRQVKGTPIEGFPNGLPDLTPLGVRITLENMIGICLRSKPCLASMIAGPDGEMVMNPIPGEAGTDYPVFTEGIIMSQNKPRPKPILAAQCQRPGSIVGNSSTCLASTQTQQPTARSA